MRNDNVWNSETIRILSRLFAGLYGLSTRSCIWAFDLHLWGFVHVGLCPMGFCPMGFCPCGLLSGYRPSLAPSETTYRVQAVLHSQQVSSSHCAVLSDGSVYSGISDDRAYTSTFVFTWRPEADNTAVSTITLRITQFRCLWSCSLELSASSR